MLRTNSQPLDRGQMRFPLLLSCSPTRLILLLVLERRRARRAHPTGAIRRPGRGPALPQERFSGAERGAGERGEARAG